MRETLLMKKAIIIACIDALAGVNICDRDNFEAKAAVVECLQLLNSIEGFETIRRKRLQAFSLDHYLMRVFTHLKGIEINGEANENSLQNLNKLLSEALQLADEELKYTPSNCLF